MSRRRIIALVIGAAVLILLVVPLATVRIKIELPPAEPPQRAS